MRKILSLSLVLMMVLALVLTGCGGNSNNSTTAAAGTTAAADKTTAAAADKTTAAAPADEATVLEWYMRADYSNVPGWANVEAKFNEKFTEDINATINWHNYGTSEYDQRAVAAMSAGQPMDIVFTAQSYLRFSTWQKAGAFAPLNDLINTYAAETKASIPQWVWDAASVNGEIYAMPTYKDVSVDMGFIYNKTMSDNLGLTDKIINSGYTYARDLEEIVYEAKELRASDEKLAEMPVLKIRSDMHIYYHADSFVNETVVTAIPGSFLNDEGLSDGTKVFNVYGTNEYAEAIKLITRWVDDNIFMYDAENWDTDGALKKSGVCLGEFTWGTAVVDPNAYEAYEQAILHPTHSFTYTGYPQAVMNAIAAHSENKEVSMQALNLMFSDPIYSTMWRFGVEGEDWNAVEVDGQMRVDFTGTDNENKADRTKTGGFYSWYHAELGNLFTCYLPLELDGSFFEVLEGMNDSAIASVNMGFVMDTEPVENEIAALAGVKSEYHDVLKTGMVPDVDATLTAFNEKLVANGVDKVIAEAQAQLDAWRAAK